MNEVRVIKSNWIDSELAEVYLYERNRISGEFEWVSLLSWRCITWGLHGWVCVG